jgi:hypothetical protein
MYQRWGESKDEEYDFFFLQWLLEWTSRGREYQRKSERELWGVHGKKGGKGSEWRGRVGRRKER